MSKLDSDLHVSSTRGSKIWQCSNRRLRLSIYNFQRSCISPQRDFDINSTSPYSEEAEGRGSKLVKLPVTRAGAEQILPPVELVQVRLNWARPAASNLVVDELHAPLAITLSHTRAVSIASRSYLLGQTASMTVSPLYW